MHRFTKHTAQTYSMVAGVTLAMAFGASYVIASLGGGDTSSTAIPYQGYLEQNGAPVDGSHSVRVRLFDPSAGGTPVYQEQHNAVAFVAGRFSLMLGTGVAVADGTSATPLVPLGNRAFEIEFSVQQPDNTWIDLQGRQSIGSVLYAHRAAPGRDFVVDSSVSIGADATIAGNITAATAAIAGSASIGTAGVGDLTVAGTLKATAGFGYVPIGTVLPWHKNIGGGSLSVPVGWVECNGGIINDALSPLNGMAIPALNNQVYAGGRGRYLRGGLSSGATNPSSLYQGNGVQYTGNGGGGYYGAAYGIWANTENGNLASYSTTDNTLGNPYVQVAAMTMVYIMRVR